MSQSKGVKPPSCSQTFCVDPDEGAVVGGADVEEGAGVGLGGVLEVALVPDGAFVVEEVGALGVPVAGDFEGAGVGEVVVLGVAVGVKGGVHEEAVFAEVLVEVVEAGGVLVDDDVPVAVKGGDEAVVDVDEEGGVGLGLERRGGCGKDKCGEQKAAWDLQHEGVSGHGVRFREVICGKCYGDIILRSLNNCFAASGCMNRLGEAVSKEVVDADRVGDEVSID